MGRYFFFILAGYLCGSILFAYLIPKYWRNIDICALSPDKNPGTFNAFHFAGSGIGSLILCLELAKGFLPVHLALTALSPGSPLFALVLAAPVIGHAFPLFRPKAGGKAIAVSFGCLLGLFPDLRFVLALAFFYLLFSVVVIVRPHLFRSIVTYLCFCISCVRTAAPRSVIWGTLLMSAVVIFKHVMRAEQQKEPFSVHLIRRDH